MRKLYAYTMTPELLEKFDKLCQKNCLNKSKVIEFLINEFVEREGNLFEFKKK